MRMIAPTTGPITSGYGVPHRPDGPVQYAVDWGFYTADPSSKNLRACAAARIVYAGPATGWGMHSDFGTIVALEWDEDGHTWQAIYCHCASITASGEVQPGTVIAIMGATGRVDGVHVHFILRRNGFTVNPLNYLSSTASSGSTPIPEPPTPLVKKILKAGRNMKCMVLGNSNTGQVAFIIAGNESYIFGSVAEYNDFLTVLSTYSSMPDTPDEWKWPTLPPIGDNQRLLFVSDPRFKVTLKALTTNN